MSRDNIAGETLSIWMEPSPEVAANTLPDSTVDICIIGAGIAGLSVAYQLARLGRHVQVLDMGPVGGGQTGRSTAHLSSAMDDGFTHLLKYYGQKATQLILASHRTAIDDIEEICERENISCDFERLSGYLFVGRGGSLDYLRKELESAVSVGFPDVELLSSIPFITIDTGPCLKFPNQAQFNPLKYLYGLTNAIQQLGGKIVTGVKVDNIEDGTEPKVHLHNGMTIICQHVVVATNTPINDRFKIHTKQAPYRTYAIAAKVQRGALLKGLYWDTEDPYHYVRLAPLDDKWEVLIAGGEDHKTGQDTHPQRRLEQLEDWMRYYFPQTKELIASWSGQVWEPVDSIAYIGRNPGDKNVYIITGDSGQGITHGTIAGRLITDLILQKDNPWTDIYDPSRKTFRSGLEYVKENVNVALQYTDYFKSSEVENADHIEPGEGAVLSHGLQKIAAYREDNGQLTMLSAHCTHLGGIVHWNSVEKSWDCPCHGSRFSKDGSVITGPAITPLGTVEEDLLTPMVVKKEIDEDLRPSFS